MRAAFIVSALMHLAILLAAVISLPDSEGFATAPVSALPVELVTIAEETDLTVGDVREAEVVEDAAETTVETEIAPEPETQPGATGQEADTVATDADARVNADESASPEPAAEPEPQPEVAEAEEPPQAPPPQEAAAEAPAEPTPEPAEQDLAALEPAPAPEPEVEAPPAPRVPETVVPQRKPTPPPRRTASRQVPDQADAFDAQRLSQLINRADPSGGGAGAARASLGAADGRAAAGLTLSEMDALRAQMQRCWNPPIGLAGGDTLIVKVQIRLLPDGGVETITDVGGGIGALYDVAVDAAKRAVIQCQPYGLPPEKYETWKDVQVTFDPRELF